MSLGESIDDLIHINLTLWHKAEGIKKHGKPDHTLPTAERVQIFRDVRALNAERSSARWGIDSLLGGGINETKIRYCEDKS